MLKQKEANKKRKLYHFTDLIKDFNFYDFKGFKYKGFKGCVYALDDYKLDFNKLETIENNYHNTKVIKTFCEYAPEIKKVWLFIAK